MGGKSLQKDGWDRLPVLRRAQAMQGKLPEYPASESGEGMAPDQERRAQAIRGHLRFTKESLVEMQ